MDSNFQNNDNNNFGANNQSENSDSPNSTQNAGNTGYTSGTENTGSTGSTGYADNTSSTGDNGSAGSSDNTDGSSSNYTSGTGNTNNGYNNNYGNPSDYNSSYYQNNSNQNQEQQNNQNYTQGSNQGNGQYSQYGGNVQYKWNYDDYQKALDQNKKPKKKKRGLKPFIITVCSVFGVAIIGLAVIGATNFATSGNIFSGTSSASAAGNSNATTMKIDSQPSTSSTTTTSGSEMTNEEVAAKLTPSVVGIEIYDLSSVEPTAEGTGIVMSSDGYIVTNAHVISGAQKICVVMSDGTKYDTVKTIGSDTKSDLAVLKIDAKGLTAATFGDSTQLKVGQAVIAIGNPGGLTFANTVTNGIVSGLNRTVSSSTSGTQMTYIQTNALINPGNSGGPLVNMYGQVVGINTAKITETGYEGIGFSIPISIAKPYIDSIIANGYVTGRVKVGISVYSLSNSQAKWYNYPSGLYVESIEQTSDAYAQGLRTKDIITEINGVAIANDDSSTVYSKFYNEEIKYKAGETVTIKVYRTQTGDTKTFKIKLEEDKGDSEESTSSSTESQSNNGSNSSSSDSSDFWSQFGQ